MRKVICIVVSLGLILTTMSALASETKYSKMSSTKATKSEPVKVEPKESKPKLTDKEAAIKLLKICVTGGLILIALRIICGPPRSGGQPD